MTPAQRWIAWSSTAAVAGTGLVYAWMAYCLSPADPMDLVNHPWQPAVRELHVLTAPLWLVAFGALWSGHAAAKLRTGGPTRRRSGLAALALAVPMAASGYLLQVAVDDGWRSLWCQVHVGSSLAWLGGFAAHGLGRWRAAAGALACRRRAEATGSRQPGPANASARGAPPS